MWAKEKTPFRGPDLQLPNSVVILIVFANLTVGVALLALATSGGAIVAVAPGNAVPVDRSAVGAAFLGKDDCHLVSLPSGVINQF